MSEDNQKREVFIVRKYVLIILAGLLVITNLFAAGCAKSSGNSDASVKERPISVKSAKVVEGTLNESTSVSGTLEALDSANIVAKASGKVAGISVDIGSAVAAGQTLMALEAEDLAAAVASAEAAVENAEITYELALKQYERGQELVQGGAIARADFENNYEGALKKAEAGLKSARAALAQSQVRYKDAFIKSPINGVVTAKNINVGELAGTSSPLITVVNLDKVVVKANVNEDQVNKLEVGQKVNVRVSAASQTPLKGVVANIALAANTTKAFPVKIQLDNRDHKLKPGMFAEVMFEWKGKKALMVPREAVLSNSEGSKVYLIKEGVVKEQKVETGATDGKNIYIISGLNKGEEVAVSNLDSLKDGYEVSVQSE